MKRILVWRYQGFIRKLQNSKKKALRNLLNLVKNDVRTTTGSNLRKIMLLSGKNTIKEVLDSRLDFEYHKLEEEEVWKEIMLKEIIDIQNEEKTMEALDNDELTDILEYLCTG